MVLDILDSLGNFVAGEFPFLFRLYDKLVVKTLQKPPAKAIFWLVFIALTVGVLVTFAPLRVLHWVNGTHWTKVLPLVQRIPAVRKIVDTVYMFLVTKLQIIYIILRALVNLALLPVNVFIRAFGSLERVRLIILLVVMPPLLLKGTYLCVDLIKEYFLTPSGSPTGSPSGSPVNVGSTAPNAKAQGRVALFVTAVMVIFVIASYNKSYVVYMFCFGSIGPMAMVLMLLAGALYVHLSLVIYVDNVLGGRIVTKKVRRKDLAAKQMEMTMVVMGAMVIGLFLLMGCNPGAFARRNLLTPRLIALE